MKELQTLQQIFQHRIFRIPDYQRGYAWGEKQWIDFWEDLVNLDTERFHYTGVLSIKSLSKQECAHWHDALWLIEDRGYRPCHIVDGQQRLTTISIFIQCLIETARLLNSGKADHEIFISSFPLNKIIEDFVVEQHAQKQMLRSFKFGYEVDNPSCNFLIQRIFNINNNERIEETYYTLNLENAKQFFLNNLAEVIQAEGPEILAELFKKLTQRLMFNVYEISDDFDVFVAFETMNNRGKKLSDLELLKNRLIFLTTLYPEEEVTPRERQIVRNAINQTWKEIYYQLGRNKKNPLNDDEFLRTHWILYFKYSRKRGDDYIRYLLDEVFNPKAILKKVAVRTDLVEDFGDTSELDDDNEDDANDETSNLVSSLAIQDIQNYVESLKSVAEHWYNTFNPKDCSSYSDEEKQWVDCLNRIGIGYFRPMVTALFATAGIAEQERVDCLKAIERFIFIGFRISRAQSNYGNSKYFNLSRMLYREGLGIKELHETLKENLSWTFSEGNLLKIGAFKEYISYKFNIEKTGFYGWNGLRYFLYEYEEALRTARNQPKLSWNLFVKGEKDRISIEHIFPQTANQSCWELHFGMLSDAEKLRCNGSLGNLIPLSASINSSLQNDCFENKKNIVFHPDGTVKRNGYKNGSYSEQEVAEASEWTPESIQARGLKLLNFMEKRWDLRLGDDKSIILGE